MSMETVNETYFGVDLGTTNTVVSKGNLLFNGLIQSQIIQVMQVDENKCSTTEFILPSVLYADENGKEYVGKIAKNIKSKASKKVLYNTKRYMGSNKVWKLGKVEYTSKDVAKHILKTCRDSMKRYNQGKDVESVTITVPASFNTDQIKDTKDAALEIGFKNVNLIPEPTSALIDFINEQSNLIESQRQVNLSESTRILVFDLGGGTCDIAIVDVIQNGRKVEFTEVAIGRYDELGGIDFDNKVALVKLNEFLEKYNLDYSSIDKEDREHMVRHLRIFAEKAKERISSDVEMNCYFGESFDHYIMNFYGEDPVQFCINKEEYDEAIKDFFIKSNLSNKRSDEEMQKNIVDPILNTFRDYNIKKDSIDYLFLTGGMTKYKLVRDKIRGILDLKENQIINSTDPLSSVAKGAAIYDYYETIINRDQVLAKEIHYEDEVSVTEDKKFELTRVLAEAIMIDVKEGLPVVIIDSNQEVPYEGKLKGALRTTSPSGVEINLYAGIDQYDSKMRIQRKYKAYFKTPKKPGTIIDIDFSIDKDKYLRLSVDVGGEKIELKQEVDLKEKETI
ncbi:Hsp70 family protein [Romboutsia sedimentorum]|uniref:Hsp70 family protein n=1 Tax=Romboutsia sedimentorum TaxID=1368474 RepID=A0ABT7E7D5_9FIRM|nr:Hsp70 family protein [Romboutsia sedimentorum]MDK2562826.1 Hsp70 family protein [Romboutsia sedimentorum]MDK2585691.1 Hsp70 family protein [Romboutsia sedimentorum]